MELELKVRLSERPVPPGWTGSSTLLLRKLRELALFILELGGSCGPPPCSFLTSISLLRLRASRSFPKEPLRLKEPLPSCGGRTVSKTYILCTLTTYLDLHTHPTPFSCRP